MAVITRAQQFFVAALELVCVHAACAHTCMRVRADERCELQEVTLVCGVACAAVLTRTLIRMDVPFAVAINNHLIKSAVFHLLSHLDSLACQNLHPPQHSKPSVSHLPTTPVPLALQLWDLGSQSPHFWLWGPQPPDLPWPLHRCHLRAAHSSSKPSIW